MVLFFGQGSSSITLAQIKGPLLLDLVVERSHRSFASDRSQAAGRVRV